MILSACFFIVVILTALDIGIKDYVDEHYALDEEKDSAVKGLTLRKTYNRGFVMNFMQERVDVVKWSTIVAALYVLISDCKVFLKKSSMIAKIGMVFTTAGMVSNCFDRLIKGKVIDYIGIKKPIGSKKVSFNLADVYLMMGFVVYILVTIGKCIKFLVKKK